MDAADGDSHTYPEDEEKLHTEAVDSTLQNRKYREKLRFQKLKKYGEQ